MLVNESNTDKPEPFSNIEQSLLFKISTQRTNTLQYLSFKEMMDIYIERKEYDYSELS